MTLKCKREISCRVYIVLAAKVRVLRNEGFHVPRSVEQSPCSCFCDNKWNKMADSAFLSIVCVGGGVGGRVGGGMRWWVEWRQGMGRRRRLKEEEKALGSKPRAGIWGKENQYLFCCQESPGHKGWVWVSLQVSSGHCEKAVLRQRA